MKKINITSFVLAVFFTAAIFSSCGTKRNPSASYMPDMGYSRAYEAYALHDTTLFTTDAAKRGGNIIFYNSTTVPGTMRRGDMQPYTLENTTMDYIKSATIKSPLTDTMNEAAMIEAGRLYNINCGICHGDKAGGNGPLATAGHVGGVANLATGEKAGLSDGTMYHVITHGKGLMGSYASQLTPKQRWEIVKYIRTLQGSKTPAADSTTAAKGADSAKVAK